MIAFLPYFGVYKAHPHLGKTNTNRKLQSTSQELQVDSSPTALKGTLLGTPNREPQEYSRNIMVYKDPGRYIPIIYLLCSWGSQFGVPSRVPLALHGFPKL